MTAGNAPVRPFTARFPHVASELAPVRRGLGAWLRNAGFHDDDAQRVLLACGEACANAVEHARPSGRTLIVLSCRIEAATGAVVVRVRDAGRWGGPAPRADRGFGLRLIGHLVDEVAVRAGAGGTAVVLRIIPSLPRGASRVKLRKEPDDGAREDGSRAAPLEPVGAVRAEAAGRGGTLAGVLLGPVVGPATADRIGACPRRPASTSRVEARLQPRVPQ